LKKRNIWFIQLLFAFIFITAIPFKGQTQGRVLINEFMPWSGCNPDGEFVELLNFGPGPMDISCYIITDGIYSATIPQGTVLQPGQFYVLAGSDILAKDCANVDSAIHVQLNWTTCNCTNIPVPTTGAGFFADGGGANQKVVFLKPNLEVVDAVTREFPVEPSNLITTTATGTCASRTFDLDNMTIPYERLGMSTGKANSFARTLDGDCVWVKDPPQSAHATNNRPGDGKSAVRYDLTHTVPQDCNNTGGTISVHVTIDSSTLVPGGLNSLFPMNYSWIRDQDQDGYDLDDPFFYGEDVTPPSIDITGLPVGTYRVVVGSVLNCFLATFNFGILTCVGPLKIEILNFDLVNETSNSYLFQWALSGTALADEIIIEKSKDGRTFTTALSITAGDEKHSAFIQSLPKEQGYPYYRLKIKGKHGSNFYSTAINTSAPLLTAFTFGPNPVSDLLRVKLFSIKQENATYTLYNSLNAVVSSGQFTLSAGTNLKQLSIKHLPSGIYQLVLLKNGGIEQPIVFRFVKQ
jgi:hypothetical protein